jgi:hypothetical protein
LAIGFLVVEVVDFLFCGTCISKVTLGIHVSCASSHLLPLPLPTFLYL